VLAVSSTTGTGIEDLRAALRALCDRISARDAAWPSPPRLAIDRAFSVRGRGTVVTGTLRGGPIRAGDELRLEPAGRPVRVREVQVHGGQRDHHDGGRTALNLAGVTVADVRRGDVLAARRTPDQPPIASSAGLLVEVSPPGEVVPAFRWPPRDGARLRLHLGTAAVGALVRRRGREAVDLPGGHLIARLTLAEPVATFVGDRGVLRQPASGVLGGGVRVLDADPPRGPSRRRITPERLTALAAALARRDRDAAGSATLALHGVRFADPVELAPDVRAGLRDTLVALVGAAATRSEPLSRGVGLADVRASLLRALRASTTIPRTSSRPAAAAIDELVASVVAGGEVARHGDRLVAPGTEGALPAELAAAMDRLEAALAVDAPPGLAAAAAAAGCPADGIRALQAAGRIVRLEPDLAWATPTYHRLAGLALEMARGQPLTPASFRDATASSRRYVLAILEDLDRRGILARTADGHVPGPRAPSTA
jgi:selenocysteine-specific elongation factor